MIDLWREIIKKNVEIENFRRNVILGFLKSFGGFSLNLENFEILVI